MAGLHKAYKGFSRASSRLALHKACIGALYDLDRVHTGVLCSIYIYTHVCKPITDAI